MVTGLLRNAHWSEDRTILYLTREYTTCASMADGGDVVSLAASPSETSSDHGTATDSQTQLSESSSDDEDVVDAVTTRVTRSTRKRERDNAKRTTRSDTKRSKP